MAIRKIIRHERRRFYLGDLKYLITIQGRAIKAPNSTVEYSEDFTLIKKVYANIVTKSGDDLFDGVSFTKSPTIYEFWIRKIPNFRVTSQDWIEYKDTRFDIIAVENFDFRDQWLKLEAVIRGDKSKNATMA